MILLYVFSGSACSTDAVVLSNRKHCNLPGIALCTYIKRKRAGTLPAGTMGKFITGFSYCLSSRLCWSIIAFLY